MTRAAQLHHYRTVERAIAFIRSQAVRQPSLEQVAAAVHMSPFHLQRVFSQWAGLSPKRFLQYLTKEHARARLLQSQTVLETAQAVGLSSPSRLHDLMITTEAMTPGDIQSAGEGVDIGFGVGASPFGEVFLAWTPRGICQLGFLDHDPDERAGRLLAQWPRARCRRDDARALSWTDAIFPAVPSRGRIHLVLRGSNFQIKVWEALMNTQPGDVLTYGHLAQRIGQPRAQRAVGSALALNDIGYLIPCHRVIQASGEVGQFRWRPDRKVAMQAWEQGVVQAEQDRA